jgi:sugar phosphate isomerase/epimerase
MSMYLSRRGILAGGAAALAVSALRPGFAFARDAAHPPAGVQLYTVRAEMAKDVPGTLKRIAEIGFGEVEFAGYFDRKPDEIKRIVADLGMTAPSSHVTALTARDDPMPLIEAAKIAGHEFLVVAWTPPETRQTIDDWKAWADVCNRFAGQCKTAGIRFAYHNHNFEFEPIGGVVPYDVMLSRTDPALVQFELDMYWAKKGGGDLVNILSNHRGRIPLCHVKDMDKAGAMADVGDGIIDFKAIFADPAIAPFEHYFYERDDAPVPFDSAVRSYKGLTEILATLPRR